MYKFIVATYIFYCYIHKHAHAYILAQSALAVEYTDCFSAEDSNSPNELSGFDPKQSIGVAPVIVELMGMRRNPLLPSLPGPLRPRVVAPDRVPFMSQKELNCVLMLN